MIKKILAGLATVLLLTFSPVIIPLALVCVCLIFCCEGIAELYSQVLHLIQRKTDDT